MTKTYTLPEAIAMAMDGKLMIRPSGDPDACHVMAKNDDSSVEIYQILDNYRHNVGFFPTDGWMIQKLKYTGKDIAFVAQHPDREWRRPRWGCAISRKHDKNTAMHMDDLVATDWETCDE